MVHGHLTRLEFVLPVLPVITARKELYCQPHVMNGNGARKELVPRRLNTVLGVTYVTLERLSPYIVMVVIIVPPSRITSTSTRRLNAKLAPIAQQGPISQLIALLGPKDMTMLGELQLILVV